MNIVAVVADNDDENIVVDDDDVNVFVMMIEFLNHFHHYHLDSYLEFWRIIIIID